MDAVSSKITGGHATLFPEKATKEMIEIAIRVDTALCDNKFISPNLLPSTIQSSIKHMVEFQETGIRQPYPTLSLEKLATYTLVKEEEIDRYAKLNGYEILWAPADPVLNTMRHIREILLDSKISNEEAQKLGFAKARYIVR